MKYIIKYTLVLLLVLTSNVTEAQFIKEKSLNIQIGYGVSSPYNGADEVADGGFFIQAELVLKATSWAEFRPYTGFISTRSNGKDLNNNPTNKKAELKALLLGAKTRLRAPIPWVVPYAEIGIGTSVGKFVTLTAIDNIEKNGITYHIPVAFGLELGKNNNIDLGVSYYFQPEVQQFAGAFAFGITIPLK